MSAFSNGLLHGVSGRALTLSHGVARIVYAIEADSCGAAAIVTVANGADTLSRRSDVHAMEPSLS